MTRFKASEAAVTLVLAGCALASCVVSPQPTPPGDQPVLDPGGLVGVESITELFAGFSGLPGSVTPPEGSVIATDLETMAEPNEAPVAPDGSFTVGVTTIGTDELRLQVRGTQRRSEPLDFLWTGGTLEAPRRPRALCLFVEPTHVALEPGGRATIEVRSACVDRVAFRAPRFRRDTLGFVVTDPAVFELSEGQRRSLTVTAPTGPGASEDVLFVETLDAPSDRRPITVYVDPPAD